MRVSLDTSAYSALRRSHAPIVDVLERATEVQISVIALGELHAGFDGGKRREQNRLDLAKFLAKPAVKVRGLDIGTAELYGEFRLYLRRIGVPLPINDIWTAARAAQNGLSVVTLDRHFARMPQIDTLLFDP